MSDSLEMPPPQGFRDSHWPFPSPGTAAGTVGFKCDVLCCDPQLWLSSHPQCLLVKLCEHCCVRGLPRGRGLQQVRGLRGFSAPAEVPSWFRRCLWARIWVLCSVTVGSALGSQSCGCGAVRLSVVASRTFPTCCPGNGGGSDALDAAGM